MDAELRNKSIHDLRVIAQSHEVSDIFEKDAARLIQEISLRLSERAPISDEMPAAPAYDARLMLSHPDARCSPTDVVDLLEPYINRGLRLTFDESGERWRMAHGLRTDDGTMRMPLRTVLDCARRLLCE